MQGNKLDFRTLENKIPIRMSGTKEREKTEKWKKLHN
jgi:hypothetical protein